MDELTPENLAQQFNALAERLRKMTIWDRVDAAANEDLRTLYAEAQRVLRLFEEDEA